MKLGLVGLGKMGYNLGLNFMDHGHEIVAYDINKEAVDRLAADGATGAYSLKEMTEKLENPKIVWLMVPAGLVDDVLNDLVPLLSEGDIVIEAGNSNYKKSLQRYEALKAKGIAFIDAGTSGGVSGARHGACYMIGGDKKAFSLVEPLFKDTAVENGYHFTGQPGGGHFLKMVHNGIEYGMMAAIAEGFEVLEKSEFDFDYEKVARVWNHGSVIRSWLMELTENAFSKDPKLESIRGVMHSSGEGKWTVETALDLQVPTPVIALSLMMRYRSLEEDTFTGKVVAALRNEFGGHEVVKKEN
ncbi:phosphogluconate dehydrogenase (NAD(+)-dependent, decarboxylating) [Caenibacillus caldisaponilyticus]|uniref:phosphogluconate dehydrogenase (NAD(+)-dependent, decarboxylating) n=1 Tax=Caenibacillus caldisaponilyticus TaxID=1674942 RepID=UPI000988814E|nr:decarboxylating 6-phosphogluconate dehydrogenase [Caenibacillus caldisaponilyticus]